MLTLYRLATGTRFTTDQWSAAGGWVGGIGTLAAVIVALWQSAQAKKQLREQLDAQLRSEQLDALASVWTAINSICPALEELDDAHASAVDSNQKTGAVRRYRWDIAHLAGDKMSSTLRDVDLAFEPSLRRIIGPHVQKKTTLMYQDFLALHGRIQTIVRTIKQDRRIASLATAKELTNGLEGQ